MAARVVEAIAVSEDPRLAETARDLIAVSPQSGHR
jgi:hypothetical protein